MSASVSKRKRRHKIDWLLHCTSWCSLRLITAERKSVFIWSKAVSVQCGCSTISIVDGQQTGRYITRLYLVDVSHKNSEATWKSINKLRNYVSGATISNYRRSLWDELAAEWWICVGTLHRVQRVCWRACVVSLSRKFINNPQFRTFPHFWCQVTKVRLLVTSNIIP